MATLTLRSQKGSPLTIGEVDTNFTNLNDELATKANSNSPTLTGTPSAPTAEVGTNTTQLATTAFVISERSASASLTNKTIESPSLTGTPSAPTAAVGTNTTQVATTAFVISERTATAELTNKTLSGVVLNDGYTEEVFALSGNTPAISPTNGTIQTWTLSANSTPTSGTWNSGQSVTLMIDDGAGYTITWSSMPVTWKTNGAAAPTLNTAGRTAIVLWKVGTVIYGARVGDS